LKAALAGRSVDHYYDLGSMLAGPGNEEASYEYLVGGERGFVGVGCGAFAQSGDVDRIHV